MKTGTDRYAEVQRMAREDVERDTQKVIDAIRILNGAEQEKVTVPFEWLERWYVLLIFGIVAVAIFIDSLIGGSQ